MGTSAGRLTRALALAALLLAAGCTTTPASPPPGDRSGYLYASPTELIFVEWDAGRPTERGSVHWQLAGSDTSTASFTVTTTEGGFDFAFEPGTLAGWTGRLADGGLQLVIPADTGGVRDISLRPASLGDFETLAAAMR